MPSRQDLENIRKFVEKQLIEMYEAMKLLNTRRQGWIEEIKQAILLNKRREQAEKEQQELNEQFRPKPPAPESKKNKEQELPTIASIMAQLINVINTVQSQTVAKVQNIVKNMPAVVSQAIVNATTKAFAPDQVLTQAAKFDAQFSKTKDASLAIAENLDQAPQFMHADLHTSAEHVMQTKQSASSVFTLAAMTNFAQEAHGAMCRVMDKDPAQTKPHEVSAEAAQKVAQDKKEVANEKKQVAKENAPVAKEAKEKALELAGKTKDMQKANAAASKQAHKEKLEKMTPEEKEQHKAAVKEQREANKAAKKAKKESGVARQPQVEAYKAADVAKKAEKTANVVEKLEAGFKEAWPTVKDQASELGKKAGNVFGKCRIAVASLQDKVAQHSAKKDEVTAHATPAPKPR